MSASWRSNSGLLVLGLLALLAACGPSAQKATSPRVGVPELDVSAGTQRLKTAFVPMARRTLVVEIDAATVAEGPDPQTFQSAWTLATGLGERLFVLDYDAREIVVFDPTGNLLERVVVPAEPETGLWGGSAITVAGDRLAVSDLARSALLFWDRDMDFRGAVSAGAEVRLEEIEGLEDGTIIGQFVPPVGAKIAVSRFDEEAREVARFGVFDLPAVDPAGILPRPLVAVDFQGRVYLALNSTFQILAEAPDGTGIWVLEVTGWPRRELNDALLERLLPSEFRELERTRRAGRAAGANIRDDTESAAYPDLLPALANIETDGERRIWVFPWVEGPDEDGLYPVDVYSASGERLFAGRIPINSWDAALGSDVYRSEHDPVGDTFRVVRYRLTLPDPDGPGTP